jgi:hypothetical protein
VRRIDLGGNTGRVILKPDALHRFSFAGRIAGACASL